MTRSKFFAVMVVLAMAFFSSACDETQTSPSPLPTPTVTPPAEAEYTFWVLERGSNQPISGATLSTSFGQFQTDESGKVIIRSTTGGFQITVTAESCLPFVLSVGKNTVSNRPPIWLKSFLILLPSASGPTTTFTKPRVFLVKETALATVWYCAVSMKILRRVFLVSSGVVMLRKCSDRSLNRVCLASK